MREKQIVLSLVLSTALLLTNASSASAGPGFGALAMQALVFAVQLAARVHIKEFWDNKAKIPFFEGYNEAISGTAEIVRVLGLSGSLWVVEIALMVPWVVKRMF